MAVRFILNNPKKGVAGSIALTVNRNYKKIKVASGHTATPGQWDKKKQRLRPDAPGATDTNGKLGRLKVDAEHLMVQHSDDTALREALRALVGRGVTSETVEAEEAPEPRVMDLYDAFVDVKRSRCRPSTLQVYEALKGHLQPYVKRAPLVSQIGPTWLEGFTTHLLKAGMTNSTANKYTTRAKGFLAWLRRGEHIERVPETKALPVAQNAPVYLTTAELQRLIKQDLSDQQDGYEAARTLFLAGCFTGQRFSDLQGMQWEHVDLEGGWWNLPVKKKAVTIRVPLPAPLRSVIQKRKEAEERTPLPALTNQRTNEYIKEVCKLAKITERVTVQTLKGGVRETETWEKWQVIATHAARRTFVTLALQSGMPMNELLGFTHDDIRVLKRYAGRDESERERHVNRIFGGLGK